MRPVYANSIAVISIILATTISQEIVFPDTQGDGTFKICRENSGRLGYCTRISLCNEAKNRTNPKICGFVSGEPVICCLYNLGVNPYACDVSDGRPGNCTSKNECPEDQRDYFGFTDNTYCIESHHVCCPFTGNSVAKSVEELCAKGRGVWSDYYFPTCGDTNVWGKDHMRQVMDGSVNKKYEDIKIKGLPISNITSSRGIIKSFIYKDRNGTRIRQHYIDDIGGHFCYVLVRGIDAGYSLSKYMALLGKKDDETGEIEWFCDGILINYNYVLTAAHCPNTKRVDIIRLGEYSHDSENDEVVPRDYLPKRIIYHHDYKPPAAYNDLALIELNETLIYHPGITPICLPWGWEEDFSSGQPKIFTVSGWGATSFLGPSSAILQEADLTLVNIEVCARNYSRLPFYNVRWPNGMSSDDTMCAIDPTVTGRDACQGDSGGPLVYRYKDSFVLGGVVSLGYGCGNPNFPGVYVPIFKKHYMDWIKSIAFVNTCPSRHFYENTMTCFYSSGNIEQII